MKRNKLMVVLLALLFFPLALSAASSTLEKKPILHFDSLQVELDTLYQTDSAKVVEVHFKNTGNADLVIRSIVADCVCMTVSYDNKPYPPQSEGVIRVSFDLSVRPQEMDKGIFISSNAGLDGELVEVRFHGYLLRDRNSKKSVKL